MEYCSSSSNTVYPKIKTEFAKVIRSGHPDNPYFEILYYDPERDEIMCGFGSYDPCQVHRWLFDYFDLKPCILAPSRQIPIEFELRRLKYPWIKCNTSES